MDVEESPSYERFGEPKSRTPRWVGVALVGALVACCCIFFAASRKAEHLLDARGVASGSVELDASVQAKQKPQLPQGEDISSHGTPFRTNRSAQDKSNSSYSSRLRPVVFFHGAAQGAGEFESMRQWIERRHPGTATLSIDLFNGADSFLPLEEQVRRVYAYLTRLVAEYPQEFGKGYNLVCHSQGALICRVVVQVMDGHRVLTFVSLAGPQMGVYGTTWLENAQPFLQNSLPIPALPPFIPGAVLRVGAGILAGQFYSMAYGKLQNTSSLANLWHDPLHVHEYLTGNTFLPRANGEIEEVSAQRRANFARLRRAVFLVGAFKRKFDSKLGLEPWQTGVFGFYKEGSDSDIVPMEEQPIFKQDTFGLKSLHDAGKLHILAVPGVEHQQWLTSEGVFEKFVLPHLSA